MKAKLHKTFDQHVWALEGVTVTQLTVDPGALRIAAWHLDGSAEFRLATQFSYTAPGGLPLAIDPEQAEQLSPLLALLARPLSQVTIQRSGQLRLTFGDGSSIEIAPDPRYEAWDASGTGAFDKLAYLCGPDGGSPWGAT